MSELTFIVIIIISISDAVSFNNLIILSFYSCTAQVKLRLSKQLISLLGLLVSYCVVPFSLARALIRILSSSLLTATFLSLQSPHIAIYWILSVTENTKCIVKNHSVIFFCDSPSMAKPSRVQDKYHRTIHYHCLLDVVNLQNSYFHF